MPQTPSRYVVLLRGINVGRAKRIAMADLRALFTELGYGDVQTLLNSGNVIFTETNPTITSADHSTRIEAAMVETLGVSGRVIVLSAPDVAAIIAENTLGDRTDDLSRLLVSVLADPADRVKLLPLIEQDWGVDRLRLAQKPPICGAVGGF